MAQTALYRHFDAETPPGMVTVYRCYAEDGDLLYVGCSVNVARRLKNHRYMKDWWPRVATVRTKHYPRGPWGWDAEHQAILFEFPRHNRPRTGGKYVRKKRATA